MPRKYIKKSREAPYPETHISDKDARTLRKLMKFNASSLQVYSWLRAYKCAKQREK